jgi:hypothetical protein
MSELTTKELISLTNQRIASLTLSELLEAITALEDDPLLAGDLLEVIRNKHNDQYDYELIGKRLMMIIYMFHEQDILLHGGL